MLYIFYRTKESRLIQSGGEMGSFVEFKNVGKTYHMGEVDIEALKGDRKSVV